VNGTSNCTATVAAATCQLTPTTSGAKTLTASYATDGTFASSTSAGVSHTVNQAPTITSATTPRSGGTQAHSRLQQLASAFDLHRD